MGYEAKHKAQRRWYLRGGNCQPKRDTSIMGRVYAKCARKHAGEFVASDEGTVGGPAKLTGRRALAAIQAALVAVGAR